MAIENISVVEEYQNDEVLIEEQLNTLASSIEDEVNAKALRNLEQLAADIFEDYTFTNDGTPSLVTPLSGSIAKHDEDETITGTWTFEEDVTLDGANIVSTGTFSSSAQQRVFTYKSASNQAIASATATAVTFDAEEYDVGPLHDVSLNSSRISIPSGGSGSYIIHGKVTFDGSKNGSRVLILYKNGAEVSRVTCHEKGASVIVEESKTVTAHAATLANIPTLVQNVYATVGSSTGNKIILPSSIAPSAGQVQINMTTGALTFNAADAVTTALVTYIYSPDSGTDTELSITYQDLAGVGDYYDLYVYQNSGASLDVLSGVSKTFFQAIRIW